MMAIPESATIVINRIEQIEPENALKIIGYLLAKRYSEQDMVRLAAAPDHLFHQFILQVKTEVQHLENNRSVVSSPLSVSVSPSLGFAPFSSPVTFRTLTNHWDPHLIVSKNMPLGFSDSSLEPQNQTQRLRLESQVGLVNSGMSVSSGDYYYPDVAMSNNLSARARRKFLSMSESSVKTCHYFNKGFCKHGSSCRFYHDQVNIPDTSSHMYGYGYGYGNDGIDEDHHVFSPGSLEKLELDIIDILKSRRGNPVSIASLPSIYYENCGKNLQAEGYLTESQRQGKVGNYSLTRLIARMKHIKLIDRPHGQHAVILKEDLHRYHENRCNDQKSDPGPIVSGSRQIYLTFPAESTFIEDDVSNYFNIFGPVEDVRIPCQQRRMFGFVSFVSSDTVKIILAKGNPHFVCGARVLVKPYREKSKLVVRKYPDRMDSPVYYPPFYSDMDSELQSMSLSRGDENSSLLRKQLMEEQERAIEFERKRIAEFQLMRKIANNQPSFGYSTNMLQLSEDNFSFQPTEPFNYLLDVLKSDDEPKHRENYTEQESSEELNLPDNPFASSSIATGQTYKRL